MATYEDDDGLLCQIVVAMVSATADFRPSSTSSVLRARERLRRGGTKREKCGIEQRARKEGIEAGQRGGFRAWDAR